MSRLRIRAAALGATEEEIDDAYDSETPRQDYVRLLLGLPVHQDGAAQARALAALTVSERRWALSARAPPALTGSERTERWMPSARTPSALTVSER